MRIDIKAELRAPIATAQIIRFDVAEHLDASMSSDGHYVLDMSLTPRPAQARGCYCDHWDAQRFERVGAIYMIPPHETVVWRSEPGRSTSVACLLRAEAVAEWLEGAESWPERSLPGCLDIHHAGLRGLLARLGEELRRPGFGAETMVELVSGQIALELARLCGDAGRASATSGLAPGRLRLIDERLGVSGAAPTLSELAELCGLSVRQLTRGFRASRGCTIGDYVAETRAEFAKQLLRGDLSIKSIARTLGFGSPASFTYAFRQRAGLTPRQFRAQIIGQVGPHRRGQIPIE